MGDKSPKSAEKRKKKFSSPKTGGDTASTPMREPIIVKSKKRSDR